MNDCEEVPRYGMLNRASNPKPMPPERAADDLDVPRLLGHINRGLTELHAAIEGLGNRLESAMSGSVTSKECQAQIGSSSEIGGRLAEVHSSIRCATERVGDFTTRLQL